MLEDRVLDTINRESLISKNEKIIVALSGGADSITLLNVLNNLKSELNIDIFAFHLNHQIRGYEAHRDALFSYRFCKSLGIPCFIKSMDIVNISKEMKLSIEETARKIRYDLLFDLKKKLNADKIAIAHNLDDQCETMLMRIFRGTGLSGLAGIKYIREDGVVRPLLNIKREEIEEYCLSNKLEYVTDSTNTKDIYTRNKLRIKIIPFIEENFAPNIKTNMYRLSQNISEDNAFIEGIANNYFKENNISEDGTIKFDIESFNNLDKVIVKRIIRIAYAYLNSSNSGIENIHLEDAYKILNSEKTITKINLPNGIIVQKNYNELLISNKEIIDVLNKNFEYELKLNDSIFIPEIGMFVETKLIDRDVNNRLNTSSNNTKSFDYGKIDGKLVVRSRRQGDKIRLLGNSGTKKVKDILIDKKIPNNKKDEIPIIVDDSKLIWILGHNISDDAKIDDKTKQILKISMIKKDMKN